MRKCTNSIEIVLSSGIGNFVSFGDKLVMYVSAKLRRFEMNRQVVYIQEKEGRKKSEPYYEKLLKLIPSETVATYLFIDGILKSSLDKRDAQLQWWLWISLIVIAIGNIYYLRRIFKVTHWVQYTIMTIAFFTWIFTIGGPFILLSWYQPFMGSVLIGLGS